MQEGSRGRGEENEGRDKRVISSLWGGRRGGGRAEKKPNTCAVLFSSLPGPDSPSVEKEGPTRWDRRVGDKGRGLKGHRCVCLGHQLLSGDGSLSRCMEVVWCLMLSRYSCWDTASTEARISSSSQSVRPNKHTPQSSEFKYQSITQ